MGAESSVDAIGPYEVLRQLPGQNREIFLARRKGDGAARVVLATFELRAEDARWLAEEVERCQRLDHEAVTRIVETFEQDGRHAVVFEAVRGVALCTLMDHLRKGRERLADSAIHYLGEMLFGALAAAHQQIDEGRRTIPLVHGQLGPHQVFVSWEGEVKLLGLGLSRVFRLAQGIEAVPAEARPFLAPEVRAGAASSTRSNVFTAASMLWSLYTQKLPPPKGDRLSPLAVERPDLPSELAELLDQAFEPLVIRRGVTAEALARVLGSFGGAQGRRELRWNVEVLRGLEAVDDGVPLSNSFPPAVLSTAPETGDEPPPAGAGRTPQDPAVPVPAGLPAVGPAESGPSSDLPTGSWQIGDREGMRDLFATVQAGEIDAATEIEPVGATAEPDAGLGAKGPAAARAAHSAAHEGGAPQPGSGALVARTLGLGRDTKPSVLGAGQPRGASPAGAPATRTEPSGDATDRKGSAGVARPLFTLAAGRIGARSTLGPAVKEVAAVPRPRAERRDPRRDDTDPPVESVGAAPPTGASTRAARPRIESRAKSPRAGAGARNAEPLGLPPPPSLPRVMVVPEAVRPSGRPPRLEEPVWQEPAGGEAPGRAPDPVFGLVRRLPSIRPRAPRSRASSLRSRAEGPVSGRLVSVRPAVSESLRPVPEPSPTLPPAELCREPSSTSPGTSGPVDTSAWPPGAQRVHSGEVRSVAGPALSDAAGAESSPAATDAPTVRQISAGRVAAVVPIRWALMVGGLVVATAVASFAVGLIAGSGPLDVRVGTEGPPAAADAPGRSERAADRPTVQPVEARGSAEGATASDGLGARGGDERSSVGAGSAAEVTADDGDDGSTLPDGLGYLLVRSSASDAHVYVAGSLAGATGKKLLVRCGLLHVRLGAVPLGEWISLGKPVSVACQGVTAVAMEPGRATELGAGKVPLPSGRSDRFSPDDL